MFQLDSIFCVSSSNKKAVSTIVAYVILISIGLSLSVLVYNWLRFYVQDTDKAECPEGVNIIVKDYDCYSDSFNVTLKNQGLFNLSGFVLRVHDEEGRKSGIYYFGNDDLRGFEEINIAPGVSINREYSFAESSKEGVLDTVTLVEIQPVVREMGEFVYCADVATQEISC